MHQRREAEEAIILQFYIGLQQLLKDVPNKDAIRIIGNWNAKVCVTEISKIVGNFGLGEGNATGQRLIEFFKKDLTVIMNTCFQQSKRRLYTWI